MSKNASASAAKTAPLMASSSARPIYEIIAVLATGGLHLIMTEGLKAKGLFVVIASWAWGVYVARRVRRDRSILRVWGYTTDGLSPAVKASSLLALIGAIGMAIFAAREGSLPLHWHMIPLLALYPLWGLIQQLLVQGMVSRNLSLLNRPYGSPWVITLVSAALFALVHLPDRTLMLCTFLLGLGFTPIYLKWRNLWPLGIYHGWLGVLAYFWLLHRDPLLDLFW